jgi:hypothetical protein
MVKEEQMQSELKRDTRIFKLLILIAIVASLLSIVRAHAADKPVSAPASDTLYTYISKAAWLKQIEDNRSWSEKQFEASLTSQQKELREAAKTFGVMYQTVKIIEQDSVRVRK